MKFTELKQHLKNSSPYPCYVVLGDDAGVRNFARRLFLSLATAMPDLNVSCFEGKITQRAIVEDCQSLPFASRYRVVIVRDYQGKTDEIEEYLNSPSPTTVLVFDNESAGTSFKKLMTKCEVVDCNRLSESFLTSYVASIAMRAGCKITMPATQLLISYCNRYVTRLDGEIAKLSSEADVIDENLVREKVSPDLEFATFALLDVIGEKDKEKAMSYLDKMVLDGNHPVAILGMLYTHFRKLFYVSVNKDSDTLSADLGVREGVLKYSLASARKYTPKALKQICDVIAESDYAFKSGRMADKTALQTCVLRILNI